MSRFIVGITGASGAIYARRLVYHLKRLNHEVLLIASKTALKVIEYERENSLFEYADSIANDDDFFAECASGNSNFSGMVILPCSMGTLGRLASGVSSSLITRSADVMLKERTPLIIVPRETPYNLIHIKNMETLTLAGAVVIPASPHFYNHPQTIDDLVDTVIAKILKHLGISEKIIPEWKSC